MAGLHRKLVLASALLLAGTSLSVSATAQSDAVRKEARQRFDRGLRLFNQGDNSGALAEFRRAYELIPHPLVLFNIGMVHATAGRPVQAVEAFDKLLADPGKLDATRVAKAKSERAEQAARIAQIEVSANVEGAAVEVDNVEVAKTPLPAPLKVSSGTHVVGVVAPGYVPIRREVTVAGGRTVDVPFELERVEGQLAHVTVHTQVPDAEVLVDGQVVGTTPLPASLAIAPGQHTVEVRRPGYTSARETMNLGSGASGEVTLEPQLDPSALGSEGGTLALEISEPEGVVFVDGAPRGAYKDPIRLPAGKHLIRVERANFFPFERSVDVPKGGVESVRVELQPTPDYRADYVSSNSSQITWGWVTVGAGALVTLGSAGFLVWNSGQESDADQKFDRVAAQPCADATNIDFSEACALEVKLALDDLESIRSREKFGWIGGGVGLAAVGFGVYLLVSADDPDRYEPKPESDVFGRLRALPTGWVQPGGGGVSVVGVF